MRTKHVLGSCILLAPFCLAQAQDSKSTTRETLARIRVILEIEHDAKTAESELRKLLGRTLSGRELANARFLLGKTLLGLGRKDEAKKQIDAAIQVSPELESEAKAVLRGGTARDKLSARVQAEIQRLMSPEESSWKAAARELEWLGERAQAQLVQELSKRTNLTEFRRILRVLVRIGGDGLVGLFEQYAKSTDPTIRNSLLQSASGVKIRDEEHRAQFVRAIRVLFGDRDAKIRKDAHELHYRMSQSTEPLRLALRDEEASIRSGIGAVLAMRQLDDLAAGKDFAGLASASKLLIERADMDAALRSGLIEQLRKGRGSAILTSTEGWPWLLRYADEAWKAGVSPRPSWRSLAPRIASKALTRTPTPTQAARAWISKAAYTCCPRLEPENYAPALELVKAAPTLDWWLKFNLEGTREQGALFVLENLATFVGQTNDTRPLLSFITSNAGARWSAEPTRRVLASMKAGLFDRPVLLSAKGLTIVTLTDQSMAKRPVSLDVLEMLARRGDYESMTPAILKFLRTAKAWKEFVHALRSDVPGDLAAELVIREPETTDRLSTTKIRNALYGRAATRGARRIVEATACAYRRGLRSSFLLGRKKTSQRCGVAWILDPPSDMKVAEFTTAQRVAIIRAAAETEPSLFWDHVPHRDTDLRNFEADVISALLEHIDRGAWTEDKTYALEGIIRNDASNRRAVELAQRVIRDPKTRDVFLADCRGRKPYRDPILEVFPDLVASGDEDRLNNAMDRLMEIGDGPSLDALAQLLSHARVSIRRMAIACLAENAKSPQALRIFDLTEDPSRDVRRSVARAASEFFRDPKIAPKILVMLSDSDAQVQKKAREALEALRFIDSQRSHWKSWLTRQGQASAAMALLTKAQDTARSKPGRLAAIDGLGLLGDVEALPFLVDLLEHEDEDFRRHAKDAITTLKTLKKSGPRK